MDLGEMIVKYAADVSGLISGSNQAKSAISGVADSAQSSGSGILGGFGKAISGAVSFGAQLGQTVIGIKGLADGAIGLGQALLAPAATAETTELSFETLLHSTSAAKKEMQDLNTFAAGTPMQTQWVDNAAAKILAFGGKVGDVKPEITAIGDSLSGLGKLSEASLNSIVDVFGKISAQGKITGGDMMQLSTWGIPAWQALSNSMHKPIPELQKMVSAGLIPASQALPALESGMEKTFGGGMAKQANTFTGLISTLQSNWQIMMASLASPALKLAETGLSAIGSALASPAFQSFATSTGQKIADVFSEIGTFISGNVVPAFQQLQPVAQQFITYFQGDSFAGIVADFQTVGNQIGLIIGDFSQLSSGAGDLTGGALSLLPGILEGIFQAADDVMFPLGQFLIWIQQAGPGQEVVKDGLIGIGAAFAAIQIGSFIATIPALIGGFAAWAGAAWTAAAGTIAATWPILAIGAIIALVVGGIILAVQHWAQISQWFGNVWHTVTNGIGGAFSALGTKAHQATSGIGDAFSHLGSSVHDSGQNVVKEFQLAGQGAVNAGKWMYDHNTYWKYAVDAITADVTAVRNWLVTTWTNATTWISNQWLKWSTLAHVYFTLIEFVIEQKIFQIVNTITEKWTGIHNWITEKWNGLKGIAQGAWDGVVGVFEGIWSRISSPLTTAGNNTENWFTGLATDAEQWGANIIQGMINGIESMFSNLGSAASNAAGVVGQFLGFHSPAKQGPGKELNVWGPNLVKGFAAGIDQSAPILQASVSHLMSVGTYPIRPSATAVASSAAMQQSASNGNRGNNTYILEVDGMELAKITQPHVDGLVRLKLHGKGRAA